ncbi:MAG: hypothetical protein H7069_06940 [Phormidesmis sp. FL-bin-119]|nr:hypothetical protein [Pedobacter sp.]
MKLLLFYYIAFVAILALFSPSVLLASAANSDKPVRKEWAKAKLPMFQDSTTAKKKSPDKPKEVQKSPQDVRDERSRETDRREIKQVPRSIPKLKPQPVSEDVKMRKPPAKSPKQGLGGYSFKKAHVVAFEPQIRAVYQEINFSVITG